MELRVYEHSDNSYPMDKILCLEKYTKEDLNNLIKCIRSVTQGNIIELSHQDFIKKNECELYLYVCETDEGIVHIKDNLYECHLSIKTYLDMIDLIKAVIISSSKDGFQWLYNLNVSIEFLLSHKGKW